MIIYLPAKRALVPASGGAEKIQVDGTNLAWFELRYDDTVEEIAHFQGQMPDNYDGGNVTLRHFWKSAAIIGSIVWATKHRGLSDDGVWDAAGSEVLFAADVAKGTAEDLNEASVVLVTPFSPSQVFQFAPIRKPGDVSDDMVGDGRLLAISLEFGLV